MTSSSGQNQKKNITEFSRKSSVDQEVEDEVKYAGHILSKNGLKPDPKKVEAVTNIGNPKNREELQRFLGMVTYLVKFISNYSQLLLPSDYC